MTFTSNHRSNEEKSIQFLYKIIFPCCESKKKELGLPEDQKSLLIYNAFAGQITEKVKARVEENHYVVVYVPKNMTDQFQPMDLTVNGPTKAFLKENHVVHQPSNGTTCKRNRSLPDRCSLEAIYP